MIYLIVGFVNAIGWLLLRSELDLGYAGYFGVCMITMLIVMPLTSIAEYFDTKDR